MPDTGLIVVESALDLSSTASKFIAAAKQAGLTIFGQRDSSKGPEGPNRPRPSILVLFGNPNVMGRLIAANPEIGIDLPMRALVWESTDGKIKLTYTDPRWVVKRHGLADQLGEIANRMASVLDQLIKAACSGPTQH
jgi:uncharacterized protein (DUF302 family)